MVRNDNFIEIKRATNLNKKGFSFYFQICVFMNWYTISKKNIARIPENSVIFGYVDTNCHVEGRIVSEKIAETYGTKNGITHLDIFGADLTLFNQLHTWHFKNGTLFWYRKPDEDEKYAVENFLSNNGINKIKHDHP